MIRPDEIVIDAVHEENFAADVIILDSINGAIEQGRQGWGVRKEQAVMLGLARQLKITLALAETADEAQRALKGEQMSHGRTKAGRQELAGVLAQATEAQAETNARLDGLGDRIRELEGERDELNETIGRANRVITGLQAQIDDGLTDPE